MREGTAEQWQTRLGNIANVRIAISPRLPNFYRALAYLQGRPRCNTIAAPAASSAAKGANWTSDAWNKHESSLLT